MEGHVVHSQPFAPPLCMRDGGSQPPPANGLAPQHLVAWTQTPWWEEVQVVLLLRVPLVLPPALRMVVARWARVPWPELALQGQGLGLGLVTPVLVPEVQGTQVQLVVAVQVKAPLAATPRPRQPRCCHHGRPETRTWLRCRPGIETALPAAASRASEGACPALTSRTPPSGC